MAQITTLKDKEGKTLYPITSSQAVLDENGVNLEMKLGNKVDKAQGKVLSSNDYTDDDKQKLDALPTNEQLTATLNGKQPSLQSSDDVFVDGTQLSLTERAKRQLFRDMWDDRCDFGGGLVVGKYDPENAPDPESPFMVNELWFTYEGAVAVYNASHPKYCATPLSYYHTYPYIKTVIPSRPSGNNNYAIFGYCNSLVNIRFLSGYATRLDDVIGGTFEFNQASKLERILNPISPSSNITSFHCPQLYDLRIALTNANCKNIDLRYSPDWSYDSVYYTVTQKTSTVTVIITVHPDVYAKLTGDTTNAAAAALSEEELAEWTALLETAAEKNIQFASA